MANLAHLIFNSWRRVVLKLVSKVFPFKKAEILLLDELDIAFGERKVNQINIPSVHLPHITSDLCPIRPELIALSISFEKQESEDLSTCLKGMPCSQIEALDLQFDGTELMLDKLEIAFEQAKKSQIDIPSISSPHTTSDLCLVRPELVELSLSLDVHNKDLSTCLKEDMSCSQIETLDFWFDRAKLSELNILFEKIKILDLTTNKRLDPTKRGGRPRGLTLDREKSQVSETKLRLKPEIVCRKREHHWIIAMEVPEEILQTSTSIMAYQNGLPLLQDDFIESWWCLTQACGRLVIRWNEDEDICETETKIGEENYLVFKLAGRNQKRGRLIKSVSYGSYLIIVPEMWERDIVLSGPPPVTPESVSIEGYIAHFFIIEKENNSKIAFRTPHGELIKVKQNLPRFELVGNQLLDTSEEVGPLFGGMPPQIRALDIDTWQYVKTIIVGEEGIGTKRWRIQFSPIQGLIKQDLPTDIHARKGVWYFLRFYDWQDELLESLDFRFIPDLKEIRKSSLSPLPSESGHEAVHVEFLHEPDCSILPADDLACEINREPSRNKTTLIIPPDPMFDETIWFLGTTGGPQVEVRISVERLWWALGEEEKEPTKWNDRCITLLRKDFAANSNKVIWLRIPRPSWIKTVHVGFKEKAARPYNIKVGEKTIEIPLRDFGDAQELQDSIGIIPFNLWVYSEESTYTATLCEITVKLHCQFCDDFFLDKDKMLLHLGSYHLDSFFQLLNYEELRNYDPSLPTGIYKCSYCDFYVKSDAPKNPTDAIVRHIRMDCEKVDRKGGEIQIRFRTITDAEEIRENVIRSLPRIFRCTLCNAHFKDDKKNMKQHLLKTHQSRLIFHNKESAYK